MFNYLDISVNKMFYDFLSTNYTKKSDQRQTSSSNIELEQKDRKLAKLSTHTHYQFHSLAFT